MDTYRRQLAKPEPARLWPHHGGAAPMPQYLLTVLEIASLIAAGVTVAFIAAVRLFWRRRKSLREP